MNFLRGTPAQCFIDRSNASGTISTVRPAAGAADGRIGSTMPRRLDSDEIAELERRRDEVRREIAELGDLRPGSLVERYRRCGKPGCRCMRPGERGHGPTWSLTRSLSGRTVTRVVPGGEAVELTRSHLAEYRRLRRLLNELLDLSERLCEARLQALQDSVSPKEPPES